MGNTAMQEVATVLVAHSGLVPEGSSRSRAASELAEMFARADGGTEALPDKGPDAAARSALEFLRRLTESLGLVEYLQIAKPSRFLGRTCASDSALFLYSLAIGDG